MVFGNLLTLRAIVSIDDKNVLCYSISVSKKNFVVSSKDFFF